MFRRIIQRWRIPDSHRRVYGQIVAQARQPTFYASLGVPDTAEGRFDMIVLHLVVALRRLRGDGAQGGALAQGLVDRFFEDMDHSLREMGVSDIAVPKRMKHLIQAFYGRAAAYEAAMEADDCAALSAAIRRNVLAGAAGAGEAEALARYVRESQVALAAQGFTRLAAGEFDWAAIPSGTSHPTEA